MKTKHFLTLIILFALVFNSCDKDDDEKKDINGGVVLTSQIVSVQNISQPLLKEEYSGIFQGKPIKLSKSLDNKLYFLVPSDALIGTHVMTIPELDNTTVNYIVQQTVLDGTPENVIADFNTSLDTFSNSLDASPEAADVNEAIENFKQIFDNSSEVDKATMATLYQANKNAFDKLILEDFETPPGRMIDVVKFNIRKNFLATAVLTVGLGLAYYSTDPGTKIMGLTLFAAGAYKARQFYLNIAEEGTYTLLLEMDGQEGLNDRNANSAITFEDNASKVISFNTKDRNVIAGDAAGAQNELAVFFATYTKYNSCVSTVNEVIAWVNINVPFASFSSIPLQELPENGTTEINGVNSQVLKSIKFSTLNPNISLVSYVLQNDGQIAVKIKINGAPTTNPIETFYILHIQRRI